MTNSSVLVGPVLVEVEISPAEIERLLSLLQGIPQPVCDQLVGRIGDFLKWRETDGLAAGVALDAAARPGRLAWVVEVVEDELIAAARAAHADFHGEPSRGG
ncbi:hypothetical protein [Aquabacterium sp. OR-4]|uniref:hypothetical protein n=1 Tax=Aquabacterium sp. OR-4 TaxID=2978127 RepID=UPI0021B3CD34|nr:hypothetical protein [Aquabacterium sp. OR-4]MDT7834987.1 hypothetical protein [Aquabacterium sp. OR-4]